MGNVFATLWMLFKGDTSDLKKSTEDAFKQTENLTKSVKSIDDASSKVGKTFKGWAEDLISAAGAFIAIQKVVSGFKDAINYDVDLANSSRALGVNAEQLDAWHNAIQRTGGTAQGFDSALTSLANHFHTTANVAMQILPQLSGIFSHLNRYSAFTLGKIYGLDEPTILLLQKGRREVESILKQQKELGLVNEKQIEIARKYDNSLFDLKHAFRSLFNEIANPYLPGLTSFFEKLTKGVQYLIQHKNLVVGALTAIGVSVGVLVTEFLIANSYILIFVGLIALAALLFEDFTVYLKGGDSLIGRFAKEFEKLDKIINNSLDTWIEKLTKFLDKFSILKPISEEIKDVREAQRNSKGIWDFALRYKLIKAQEQLDIANNSPINSQNNNSILNNSALNKNSNINIENIVIQTQATDADGIAQDIGFRLQDHLKHANYFFANSNNA